MMAMDSSAHHVTGREGLYRAVEFAGRTDLQIARDLLRAAGNDAPTDVDVAALIDAYLEALERGVERQPYRTAGRVSDGIDALRAAGAVIGLGTGNVRRGARIKLVSAGLMDRFDLELGGFGDDADTRDALLRVGARRCDPEGKLPVVVVGDTPHDIRAAKAIGARCIGVSTGPYPLAALQPFGADLLVESLDGDLASLVATLL